MINPLRKKIAYKLVLLIVLVVALVSTLSIFYFNTINKRNLTDALHISLSNAIHFAEKVYARPLWDFNENEIERLNSIILDNQLIVAVNVFDTDTFMNGTMKEKEGQTTRGGLSPFDFQFDSKNAVSENQIKKQSTSQLRKLFSPYAPPSGAQHIEKVIGSIILDGAEIGHFELFYTEAFIIDAVAMANNRMIMTFTMNALLIIIAVISSVTRINRPIVILAEIIEKMVRENTYDLPITRSNRIDEVGTLVNGFADMIAQLKNKEKERDEMHGELRANLIHFRSLFKTLQKAIDHGDYTQQISSEGGDDKLSGALNKVMIALKTADQNTRNLSWLKNGQAELSALIGRERDMDAICSKTIRFIAEYVDAKVGTFFLKNQLDDHFDMVSTFAFKNRKGLHNRLKLGDGLAGQAALEKKPILFTDVPPDYMQISSSLGYAAPGTIIVLPLIYENDVKGVIELGTMSEFSDIQIELLEKLAEITAVAVNGALFNEKVAALLEQTQEQTEELRVQQEELKATNEELEEQANILKESEEKLQTQQEELQASNEELEEKTELLQSQKREIEKSNVALQQKQKEVAEKAEQLALETKYKSEFLANMSHELRTPLNSLLILAGMLAENSENNLTEDQIESAASIYRSGQNLLYLINDILDLSKIEANQMELNISTFPLKEVGEHFKTEFMHMAKKKGIEFNVTMDTPLPETMTSDMHRLEQIIRNLIGNAIKFTDKGGVALSFSKPDKDQFPTEFQDGEFPHALSPSIPPFTHENGIAIAVRDTGIGISKENRDRIFDAFKQADGSIRRKHDGTGLGLSISKELTRMLGGRIDLESEPGVGSTFTLYMPEHFSTVTSGEETPPLSLSPISSMDKTKKDAFSKTGSDTAIPPDMNEDTKRAASPNESAKIEPDFPHDFPPPIQTDASNSKATLQRGASKTMLIIEDDPEFAQILSKFFSKNGYHTIVTPTGEEGIKYVSDHPPTAIILDLMLPGIDGWAVMNELKSNPETRHIPVHIMSGFDHRRKGLKQGAVGYLTKPISVEDLHHALERIDHVLSNDVKNLLVVEDDKELQLSILKLVESNHINVMPAETGEEALTLLKQNSFDCMILDLGLPDISGFEILDIISRDEEIEMLPVIIYTGRDLTAQEAEKLEQYAGAIVLKNAVSMDRLIDETALFLHRVESDMSENQKNIIKKIREQESTLSGKKVMVVDDDMRNAFALNKFLKNKGMEVIIANNGEKALTLLRQEDPPDIILMDIMMPVKDGFETIREIRKQKEFQTLPIIALTAKAMASDRDECIRCGANDYLSKPLDTSKLLTLLRVWLYN